LPRVLQEFLGDAPERVALLHRVAQGGVFLQPDLAGGFGRRGRLRGGLSARGAGQQHQRRGGESASAETEKGLKLVILLHGCTPRHADPILAQTWRFWTSCIIPTSGCAKRRSPWNASTPRCSGWSTTCSRRC